MYRPGENQTRKVELREGYVMSGYQAPPIVDHRFEGSYYNFIVSFLSESSKCFSLFLFDFNFNFLIKIKSQFINVGGDIKVTIFSNCQVCIHVDFYTML